MPIRAAGTPAFDIVRLAHLELTVTDLDRSRAFYVDALGLVETARDGTGEAGTLYLRGLEERSHHALVLRQGSAPACTRIGYRVRSEDDLDRAYELFAGMGLEAAWAVREGQSRTLHVRDPFGVPLAFYVRSDQQPRLLQSYGAYRGAAVQRIDHCNCFAADLQATYDFYAGRLGFRTSEYTETEPEDGSEGALWGAWLQRKGNVHDLALTNGRGPRLHHVGLWTRGELDILHACDVLASTGWLRAIERGPGRHGISNAFFLYLRDPDGHRVELFTGDYLTVDPDFEPIRWTLDDPRRQTLWGQPAPTSWFEEGTPFDGVEVAEPRLQARPIQMG